ncbi:hypothetical protein Acy02nite_47260 [Actinoplanes cyaneus]|uniref:Uncharacterized protein n=1 Tax=Actinoplanes cyaneus TaxID=52696 RepID=A0A919M241_9ACTN|nr:hypothetical protein [Actinoplanes cyaneus]MCW2138821.1 hypothetical protein [Actinoplanes cyaneus]GID66845.1 hypothetical protein Acy02nite_47260 [Actinoplanes cyaneus]
MADDLVTSFRLELSADDIADLEDLRSLREWLRDDPRVGPHTLPGASDATADPERMGIVGDSLQFVADTGLDVAALVVAIVAWRDSRPVQRQPKVTILRGERKLEITGDPETIERIVRLLDDEDGGA